jgi:CRP/FNR family cyclic AMP-dependent transcriptional regulator
MQAAFPDLLDLIGKDCGAVALEPGEVLFVEGDLATAMYVVKSGSLQVRSGSVIYEDIKVGDIVGEMALVEQSYQRSATVYALTTCELWEVNEARFLELILLAPDFALLVMRVLSRRLRAMDRRYTPERWSGIGTIASLNR